MPRITDPKRSLRKVPADEPCSRDVMQNVLGLPSPADANRERDARRRLEMLSLINRAGLTLRRHRIALGPSAYATFHAMTELADELAGVRGFSRDRDSMRRAVGAWADGLHRQLRGEQPKAA